MFGLGFTELLFVGVLALLLIGPEELPQVARTLGRFLNELKRGTDTLKDEFHQSARKVKDEMNLDPAKWRDQPKETEKTPELTTEEKRDE